jgi:hypothetical protein
VTSTPENLLWKGSEVHSLTYGYKLYRYNSLVENVKT